MVSWKMYVTLSYAKSVAIATKVHHWSCSVPTPARTELKKGALFLSEGEVCTQLGYVYKGMVRQFYFKNKKELTEHFASEDNIFICIESFLRQRPANLLVEDRKSTRLNSSHAT